MGLHDKISVLKRKRRDHLSLFHSLFLSPIRAQQNSGCLQGRAKSGNRTDCHLDLGPSQPPVRDKFLLFKPPNLWYFVTCILSQDNVNGKKYI